MVGACGKFTTRGSLDVPRLNDAALMTLIDLFGRKQPLGQIYRRFREQDTTELTLPEFFEIVWLLNQHSIVLDSRNFRGMLGGVGAIGCGGAAGSAALAPGALTPAHRLRPFVRDGAEVLDPLVHLAVLQGRVREAPQA